MAEVWRAHDRLLNRPVVVKFLKVANPDGVPARRFLREAAILARIESPQVVGVHDVGIDRENRRLFLILQYIEGRTLRQAMPRGESLNLATAVRWASELCVAAAHVHDRGLVHRDLKPSNVMLRPSGPKGQDSRLVLLDFGIARPLPGNPDLGGADLTQVGQLMGTPEYMSPEQFLGEVAGPATDLYAIGCMLFEMVTGRQPYAEGRGDFGLLLELHRGAPVPSVRRLRPDLPAALEDLVTALLAKSPQQRPQHAKEVLEALSGLGGRTAGRSSEGHPGRREERGGPGNEGARNDRGNHGERGEQRDQGRGEQRDQRERGEQGDRGDAARLRRVEELFEKANADARTPEDLVIRLRDVWDVALGTLSAEHRTTWLVTLHLALAVRQAGRPAEAAGLLRSLAAGLASRLETTDPLVLTCALHLARFTGESGGAAEAAQAAAGLRELLKSLAGALPADDRLLLDVRFELAHWLDASGDLAGSAAQFNAILTDYEVIHGLAHPETRQLRAEITRRFPPPSSP